MKILLVGGSKSGKSGLAQNIVRALAAEGAAYYWAAMEPVDYEDEARIAAHIRDREGLGFITIERGRELLTAPELSAPSPLSDAAVLFDSVTALLANEMFAPDGGFDPAAAERCAQGLLRLADSVGYIVCVCDDIFRDGTDYGPSTEAYRRGLALVCRRLAERFDAVCEVAAGVPAVIKGVLPCIPSMQRGVK